MSFDNVGMIANSMNGTTSPTLIASTQQVQDAVQAGGEYVSRAIYKTFYCASYGVTFPVVFLAHLIPGGVPLAAGIADGVRAARIYVRGVQKAQQHPTRSGESPERW